MRLLNNKTRVHRFQAVDPNPHKRYEVQRDTTVFDFALPRTALLLELPQGRPFYAGSTIKAK